MGQLYNSVIDSNNCEWLKPQLVVDGDESSYYTYAMKFIHLDIKWVDLEKNM